jgi:hypothetical protein
MITIPTTIAALLPILATIISSWLNDDQLTPGGNALIALAALLVTSAACELLSADLPVSWPLRLVGVLAYIGVLMNGDLSVLYQYLVKQPSPLAPAPKTPVAPPQPITFNSK